MPIQVGVVRYSSVALRILDALRIEPAPDCRIGQGRICLTFRRLGASHWSEEQRIAHALGVAAVVRRVLEQDSRASLRDRAGRAIVVTYEDASLVRACAVVATWECVVPAAAGS